MARRKHNSKTYGIADRFKKDCLEQGMSLLWPSERVWNLATVEALLAAIDGAPDMSDRSFYEKLETQLTGQPLTVYRAAVDTLAIYFLFPQKISPAAKSARLQLVASWRDPEPIPGLGDLADAFSEGGIGVPGTYYNTGIFWHYTFLLHFFIGILAGEADPADPRACQELADRIEARRERKSGLGRNVVLHLLFPDEFERVSTSGHKVSIVEAFGDASTPKDLDSALASIRQGLSRESGNADFDFYDPDVRARWQKPDVIPDEEQQDDDTKESGTAAAPRVWVEKTHVKGRPDRMSGDLAMGHALWSPKQSKSGGDVYRFMRDVSPGDIVLHLTDNEGITGYSVASSSWEDFTGISGTDWGGSPAYLVRLEQYHALQPPLPREVLFGAPWGQRLVALLDAGQRNSFYNREPSLNQGAYLTPVPPQLLAVLTHAYESVTGRPLLPDSLQPIVPRQVEGPMPAREDLAEVVASFSERLRDADLVFGTHHDEIVRAFVASLAAKRFAILTGLSGSGKSQLAIKFGQWLGASRYCVVSVRPDWNGPDALFGYEDALTRSTDGRKGWHVPEALEFMLRAARDQAHPYALVLDEMNLAHVERYFADALSGLETTEGCLPNLQQDTSGVWSLAETGHPKLPFPKNLFVLGTVNVDETTYLFSPKVLDRANTFEFRVSSADLSQLARKPGDVLPGDPELVRGFLAMSRQDDWQSRNPAPWADDFAERLRTLHNLLSESSLEFGHRVYYEAIRFAAFHAAAGGAGITSALDRQVLQKVLPRIHGSRKRVEAGICALGKYCYDLSHIPHAVGSNTPVTFDPVTADLSLAALPLALEKLQRMLRTLRTNQFTSFTD